MDEPQDEIDELRQLFPGASRCEEGGTTFYFVPNLPLPDGCTPTCMDALLCPTPRDGYPSRLFFAEPIDGPVVRNWNANNVRILERNWHAFSWLDVPSGRLTDLVLAYLRALLP